MRRLQPYFQGRLLQVYTEYTLQKVLANVHESGRLDEWASFLSPYNIIFKGQSSENGQAIASLLSDFPIKEILYDDDEGITDPSPDTALR